MIKKILFLIFITSKLLAQNQNSVWIFGDSSGINFSNINNPVAINSGMRGRGSCVSICDTSGNLLLYSFTVESSGAWSTHIFNSTDSSVTGADSITGLAWYNELALLPKPNSQNQYFLFSIGLEQAINQGLYLTTIDMSLNGGLGGVVQQNVQINNLNYGDCLTAVKHGNGRDWWVIGKLHTVPSTFYNRFLVYLVTPDSIYPPSIYDFNDASDGTFQKIVWHPDYNKLMVVNARGYMSEFNFDRCSGAITLNKNIFPEQSSNFNRPFWEGAYSPNGNVFYVSRTSYGGNAGDYNYLLQYDLLATDIPASCDTLDSTLYPIADCGAVRLAPDGKIYYSQAYPWGFPYQDSMYNYVNQNLGVINNPDVVGNGCNFAPFSFYLGGKRTYYGLPNNPNYSLGPLVGSLCDTLSTGLSLPVSEKRGVIYLSPNPAHSVLYFNAQQVKGKEALIIITNAMGAIVFKKKLQVYNGGYATSRIDVSGFSNGIYFITLQSEKQVLSAKFVKN